MERGGGDRKALSGYINVLSGTLSRPGVSRVPTDRARTPSVWLATITFLIWLRFRTYKTVRRGNYEIEIRLSLEMNLDAAAA